MGCLLVSFMVERDVLRLFSDTNLTMSVASPLEKGSSYYKPCHCYAVCNFDLSILPVNLNLPMVCKPLPWRLTHDSAAPSIGDMTGGYLSNPIGNIYQFNLLTTHNISQFYIDLNLSNYQDLCKVLTGLQDQPFKISRDIMTFIRTNEKDLVNYDLLAPKEFAHANITELMHVVRDEYLNNREEYASKYGVYYNYDELFRLTLEYVQQARYESFIFQLAEAYSGFKFYLPAFTDLRGRIYRAGIIHFHERDLVRGLLAFAEKPEVSRIMASLEPPFPLT